MLLLLFLRTFCTLLWLHSVFFSTTVIWVEYSIQVMKFCRYVFDHSTALLANPIGELVRFKVACLVCQLLSGQVPLFWQMTAASCPTALGAFCGQLMFWRASCREHSAVTATELLQSLDLAQSRHHLRTVQMTAEDTLFCKLWTWCSVTSDIWHFRKILTYLLIATQSPCWLGDKCEWMHILADRQLNYLCYIFI